VGAAILELLFTAAVVAAGGRGVLGQSSEAAAAEPAPGWAAKAGDDEVSWAELDQLLAERHAMSETGRAALRHLLRARLLDELARESSLVVTPEAVERRWRELEREIAAAGDGSTLQDHLRQSRVPRETFREFLRLAIVQETLARRALGVPEGRAVPGEQQEMWLDQIVEQRGASYPTPPWADGVAARCGSVVVRTPEFLEHLRGQISEQDVREACYQILLVRRMVERMPDLAGEALDSAVDAELARRRAETAADPKFKGLSYEQVVAASGVRLDTLRRDPAILSSALAHLWVDRGWGEAGLKRAYREERQLYDGRFGEAVEARAIFLRAAVLTNPLNPRSFDDAERELARVKARIQGPADFERLAATTSEDPATREAKGLLGWVTAGDERVPDEIRAALFPGAGGPPSGLLGPLRLPTGVAILWAGERRPAPGWEEMAQHVHRELRRRFVEECLPPASLVTFLEER